ncbi:MAG: FAD:protein FMN transferase [Cytophagales bacterium]|nr:FAD:protein FMN transferase [Cytophagales bacterium]
MNKKTLSIAFTSILVIVTIITLIPRGKSSNLIHITGQTMGTISYNVKVVGNEFETHKESIDSLLDVFNQSLSTYISDSEVSIFNQTSVLKNPSRLFVDVLKKSQLVYEQTDGAFDPTVGPLIQVWGFGPDKILTVPDSSMIDSILLLVSLEKIQYENNRVTKDQNMELDFSAIAKGQAVDEVAKWLEQRGATSYLVEIGGEVRCSGTNEKGRTWSIGIEDPTVEQFEIRPLAVARLQDLAVATSGNYRNYYEKDGQIYAHIIDSRTGYSTNHNLLSSSVFASDCMTADAFATAFMVLGLEESIRIVENDPDLDAVFVFTSEVETDIYVSTGITDAIELTEMSE